MACIASGCANWTETSFLDCKKNYSAEETEEFLYTPAGKWTIKIGLPIILTFGVFGNSSFLFVLYRARNIRSVTMRHMLNETNFYLANLALADLCYLIVAGTRYLIDTYKTPLNLDFSFNTDVGCALPTFIVYAAYFTSVWLITLVAMERYLAICKTFKHRGIRSKRRSISLVVVAWVVSAAMASFSLPWKSVYICIAWPSQPSHSHFPLSPSRIPVCEFTCVWCELLLILLDGGQFMFAFILNSFLYAKIIQTLQSRPESSRSRSGSTSSTRSGFESTISATKGRSSSTISAVFNTTLYQAPEKRSTHHETRQVARMLIANAFIFFWCLFPFAIINNTDAFIKNRNGEGFLSPNWFGWYGKMMSLINSAINPYIYSLFNRRYRLAFMEAFNIR